MTTPSSPSGVPVDAIDVMAYTVPTETPESDGTLSWDSTTMVVVEAVGGGHTGVGYSYNHPSTVDVVKRSLADVVVGEDVFSLPRLWEAMSRRTRNFGRTGMVSSAIAAVDNALWDLAARVRDTALCRLLGEYRSSVPLYGSGGFTSMTHAELVDQLASWAGVGFERVKMKVGSDPSKDPERVGIVRRELGPGIGLMVDANGAYGRKQAIDLAVRFSEEGVEWFEEPVSSDDLDGLRLIRDRGPAGMDIAAGEYLFEQYSALQMLARGAVDVLQIDVTRCGGISEFMRIAAVANAHSVPISTHTAPAQHLHVACAVPGLVHVEWFHDHARMEPMVFDGTAEPESGRLVPGAGRPGNGLSLDRRRAEPFRVA